MTAPNMNTILGLSLVSVNVAQNQTTDNISLQGITLPSTVSYYNQFFQVATVSTPVTLPAATTFVVFVRNLSANNITVTWTPVSGSSQSMVLVPVTAGFGGVFLYFQTAETAGGLTALSLTAAGGTSSVEIYLAA